MASFLTGLLSPRRGAVNENNAIELHPEQPEQDDDMFDLLFGMDAGDEIFAELEDAPGAQGPMAITDGMDVGDKADNAFEQVLKRLKTRRKPARLSNDDCEQRLAALLNIMRESAEDDETAHKMDKPCVAKLRTLPILMREMRRVELRDGFVVSGGVDVLRIWLSPLEDGTQPNNTITKTILELLSKLPISTEALRASEIGKTVATIFKDEKQPTNHRRMAEDLISLWLRPMLGLNNSYAVMVEENQEALRLGMNPEAVTHGGLSPKTGGISPEDLGMSPSNTNRVRTPKGIKMTTKARFYAESPKKKGSPTSNRSRTSERSRQGMSPAHSVNSNNVDDLAMSHFAPEESRHARREMGKIVNNFVALPDYENIKYRRLSKRAQREIVNKNTRRNRITKNMSKLHNKDACKQSRPHKNDAVGVSGIKNLYSAQMS